MKQKLELSPQAMKSINEHVEDFKKYMMNELRISGVTSASFHFKMDVQDGKTVVDFSINKVLRNEGRIE